MVTQPNYLNHLHNAGVVFGGEDLLGAPVLLQESCINNIGEVATTNEQQPEPLRYAAVPSGSQQFLQPRPDATDKLLFRHLRRKPAAATVLSDIVQHHEIGPVTPIFTLSLI